MLGSPDCDCFSERNLAPNEFFQQHYAFRVPIVPFLSTRRERRVSHVTRGLELFLAVL